MQMIIIKQLLLALLRLKQARTLLRPDRYLVDQSIWYNNVTKSMTMVQVIDSFATFVHKNGLISKDKFMTGMTSDDINLLLVWLSMLVVVPVKQMSFF